MDAQGRSLGLIKHGRLKGYAGFRVDSMGFVFSRRFFSMPWGIYPNIKRNNMKIGPVGFACIYVIIVVTSFLKGLFKGLMMAGKG